ncbi:facilitated trehalose transporter Tret1-like isoform X2 [Pseudomyrmex gracilis]|uniref:facilitated trehalose transporter Tret1-like isoform X2 n=1 Tax=Pseudomyrmex gracilis TaxID=219809 RepID=UPI000994C1AA|nr:facilitated trehalose transporter Tret1-like isoform X2 [Pseudomyrmex gracilis]
MYPRLNLRREVLFLLFYTILCNLNMIAIGSMWGYTSVALPILRKNNTSSITLNDTETFLFLTLTLINQIVGSLLCLVAMKYGRRCAMISASVTSLAGWLLIASSYNVIQLLAGRVLTGMSFGLSLSPSTVYIGEIAISSWKECLTAVPIASMSIGIFYVYLLGFLIQDSWKLIAIFCIIPSLLFVFCIFIIPESPGWLLVKGRKEAARNALLRIRGLHRETREFEEEFARLISYIESKKNEMFQLTCLSTDVSSANKESSSSLTSNAWNKLKNIWTIMRLPEVWKPLVILNVYFLIMQFNGMYTVIVYSVTMVINAKITMDPRLVTVIIGLIMMIMSFVTVGCSPRIGRRTISIVSNVGMSISMGGLAMYTQFFEKINIGEIPLIFGSFGLMIPWALIGELYPTKYVGVLGPLTNFFTILCTAVNVHIYPLMVRWNKVATIFYCYSAMSFLIAIYTTILPETRGKSKTQIEEIFRGKQKSTKSEFENACKTNEAIDTTTL